MCSRSRPPPTSRTPGETSRAHARPDRAYRRRPAGRVPARAALGERWLALTTEALVIWGERDAFGSPEDGEALVARNPSFLRVAGAGHQLAVDAPETAIAEIEHSSTERHEGRF